MACNKKTHPHYPQYHIVTAYFPKKENLLIPNIDYVITYMSAISQTYFGLVFRRFSLGTKLAT